MRISHARSLAVAAVGALAVTGLAGVATPSAHAADSGVAFLSQYNPGHDATVRNDGNDTAITLAALRLDPAATIGFQVNPNPDATDTSAGWTAINGGYSETGDVVSLFWNGNNYRGVSLLGRTVALRAVAIPAGGDPTYSRRNRVRLADESSTAHAVSLDGGVAPFFTQPYADSGHTDTIAHVQGSTSATDGTVALSWRGPDGAFGGSTDATVTPTSFKDPMSPTFTPGGLFSSPVDITGSGAEAGDVIAFGAHRDTDDVRPLTLQPQVINSIYQSTTTWPKNGEEAQVSLRVVDNGSLAVVGAEVRRSSDGALVGYTDETGTVTAMQADDTTETYYVNATDGDEYLDTDGDKITSDVVVDGYDPQPTYTGTSFADGDVFDDDEYADGDLGVQVTDQANNPVGAGVPVVYRYYPVGGTAPATLQQSTTDADGVAPVDFDTATENGDVVLEFRLGTETDPALGDPLASEQFTAGQADLRLAPDPGSGVAPIGGTIAYVGSLSVEDRPLTGRKVSLQYVRGLEVVPGRTADAGMVTDAGRVLRQTLVTNGRGLFRTSVADRQENVAASEVGGRLIATTATNVATDASTLTGNAGDRSISATRFGNGRRGSVQVRLYGTNGSNGADVLRVAAPASVSGETVKVFRVEGGRLVLERSAVLNGDGDLPYVGIRDRNGAETTTYVVRLLASKRVLGATSNTRELS